LSIPICHFSAREQELLKIPPFDTIGSPIEIVKSFGGRDEYLKALKELEEIIYKAA